MCIRDSRSGACAVVHGCVGRIHACQSADHRLIFKYGLEYALAYFRLIRRICGQKLLLAVSYTHLVTVHIPADFLMVSMDATLIEQVIINLLENAVKHSHTDRPIELNVTEMSDHIRFEVKDYGTGLREDLLPTLFDGSAGYESGSSDASKGMGIGLSICKTIIHSHGGTITAANPVSYTHLDVYKRQRKICSKYVLAFSSTCSLDSAFLPLDLPLGSPIRPVKSPITITAVCPRSCIWRIFLRTTAWPVSYTHLDVYKRQV